MQYAELFCQSHFSFLTSAASPEQLVSTAASLGYRALALTDECSVAGVVRAHRQIRQQQLNIRLIVGAYFCYGADLQLVLLCKDRRGYAELCRIISNSRRRAEKGQYQLEEWDLKSCRDCLVLWLPNGSPAADQYWGNWLSRQFGERLYLAQQRLLDAQDQPYQQHCQQLAEQFDLCACAVGAVLMHEPAQQPLLDVMTAIRRGVTVAEAGLALSANRERTLRPLAKLSHLFSAKLLTQTVRIAEACQFDLDSLRYEYPAELVPPGQSAMQYLAQLVKEGSLLRFGATPPADISAQIDHEMQLIAELDYPYYFLTIADIARFAREQQILYQGRGSAANSVVCYCLQITAVDPRKISVLFERFISRERDEPPDIDVDFEHERREEVIQYIYRKYGRQRAALAATVICYRLRSSLRDVGKALGFASTQLEYWLSQLNRRHPDQHWSQQLAAHGLDITSLPAQQLVQLVEQIRGKPRHLSQHVGGFVISAGPLHELVPVENAAMAERTVIQWDKDDLETLGLMKVDILALGMLTALRKALALINQQRTAPLTLAGISQTGDDSLVYQQIQQADTIGVFQIESRAQMSMLPRLKPACFYDLVIEIAIVRPGPIQGDMVHPFLRRRDGLEPVSYPSEEVASVLSRTMGVPIFQEQVIKLAMVAAGFSGGEADQLRRAMASWKKTGELMQFKPKLINGMLARGYPKAYAEQIFAQICGFGEYGFPESHSASFALLAYASAWLKCYYPLQFLTALLNSQPMGFYSASQLIQDGRRHGLQILPVCIQRSGWDHQIEHTDTGPALRLGLRQVKGLQQDLLTPLLLHRPAAGFASLSALKQTGVRQDQLNALASSDALQQLAGHRFASRWQLLDRLDELPLFRHTPPTAAPPERTSVLQSQPAGSQLGLDLSAPDLSAAKIAQPATAAELSASALALSAPAAQSNSPATPHCPLAAPDAWQQLDEDYQSLGLSLTQHPVALLRTAPALARLSLPRACDLAGCRHGQVLRVIGLVTVRQSPGTAAGVTFVTLEDETGQINLIIWQATALAQQKTFLSSRLWLVHGILQREGLVSHLIAGKIESLDALMPQFNSPSRDFH